MTEEILCQIIESIECEIEKEHSTDGCFSEPTREDPETLAVGSDIA
jgi:hypothetical protein